MTTSLSRWLGSLHEADPEEAFPVAFLRGQALFFCLSRDFLFNTHSQADLTGEWEQG